MVDRGRIELPTLRLQGERSPAELPARKWWQEEELNLRRADFQSAALPLSYLAVIGADREGRTPDILVGNEILYR